MSTATPLPMPMPQLSRAVTEWVDSVRQLTEPADVHWCDGSAAERERLIAELVREGQLLRLNPEHFPDCHLYRSHPGDVARVEHLTYICTRSR